MRPSASRLGAGGGLKTRRGDEPSLGFDDDLVLQVAQCYQRSRSEQVSSWKELRCPDALMSSLACTSRYHKSGWQEWHVDGPAATPRGAPALADVAAGPAAGLGAAPAKAGRVPESPLPPLCQPVHRRQPIMDLL